MSDPLDHDTIRRAKAAAGLLGSKYEGERQAALAALDRLLPGKLGGLLTGALDAAAKPVFKAPAPTPVAVLREWQRKATLLLCSGHPFNHRERVFIRNMARQQSEPSSAQSAWLSALFDRADEGRRSGND